MYALFLSSLILSASPATPTEVTASAATEAGGRNEIIVDQPQNAPNPFGYIAPEEVTPPTQDTKRPQQDISSTHPPSEPTPIINQFATIDPKDMNPLDYKDKIENTIYQSGDRLIIIQSVPIKYIKQATEPNTQPSINTFPSF